MQKPNIRIYELGRELNLSSKAVLDMCQHLKIAARTASNSITALEAQTLRSMARQPQALAQDESQASGQGVTGERQTGSSLPPLDLQAPKYYFNRELSWLNFNSRVLHEALDERTPLLERLKFLAIYSTNLDEYFMVRISGLKQQVAAGVARRSLDGLTPQAQLAAIRQKLLPQVVKQHQYFAQILRPALKAAGLCLADYATLNPDQTQYLQHYYLEQIFPVLTPLAVDPGHPFPYISNLSLNLAIMVKDAQTEERFFARVKVPNMLPRVVPLTSIDCVTENQCEWIGVPIEQVIQHNLQSLFPGMTIEACYPFRITRNADFELQENEADDLLLAIEQELRKRRFGSVVRVEILTETPGFMRQRLMQELALQESDVYAVDSFLGLQDLMAVATLPFPELKDRPWTPTVPRSLQQLDPFEPGSGDEGGDIFAVLREGDVLVHHPYESFPASVQRFINQAARDPNVITIKMTLYRTAGDSKFGQTSIVDSLVEAAENGKQVVVLVELKARFDEENNIQWARHLEQVGVHVVYGLLGLKTHTKIAMVVRREQERLCRYVHIGTGNYNPKTARLYTDLGLLSCREALGADLTELFNYLTGVSRQQQYRKLLVAPMTLRDRISELIDQEVTNQRQGKPARIIAKMNSLIDKKTIMALYQASQAGVQIDLIVRGICSLRPGIPGVSDNIRVMSIIGRFLEHDRIFYFENLGTPTVLIGSADWRARNLDRRVEAVVPVEEPVLAQRLHDLLMLLLADNRYAWDLQANGDYLQRRPQADEPERGAHQILMEQALNRAYGESTKKV